MALDFFHFYLFLLSLGINPCIRHFLTTPLFSREKQKLFIQGLYFLGRPNYHI